MTTLILQQRGDKWLLRHRGEIFPFLEGRWKDLVHYIKQNFTGRGLVEMQRENGETANVPIHSLMSDLD